MDNELTLINVVNQYTLLAIPVVLLVFASLAAKWGNLK